MHQVTREDTAGAGANERENNANHDEDGYEAPGPSELRTVHEPEQHTSQDDSGPDAEGASKERIEITAEKGLFDERSDEDGHGHEHQGDLTVFEEFFHGQIFRCFHARGQNRNKKRKATAGSKIDERIAGQLARTGLDRTPAERPPKGVSTKDGQGNVQEKENRGVPEQHAANRELRLGEQIFLELGSGQTLSLRSVMDGQDTLNENEAGESKEEKQDEMRPGPGDLKVFRIGGRSRNRLSFGECGDFSDGRERRRGQLRFRRAAVSVGRRLFGR